MTQGGTGTDEDSTTALEDETTTTAPGDGSTSTPVGMTTGPSEEGSSSDGGPVGNCTNMATCASAAAFGGVAGDLGSQSIETMGTEPTWVSFQVAENDDSLTGAPMSFTATLVSPPGADFDLIVYRGVEGGSSGCGGFMQQSQQAGAIDMVSMSWGEGGVANGTDDSVWVAVEILAKDDLCAPPEQWTLTVQGNT